MANSESRRQFSVTLVVEQTQCTFTTYLYSPHSGEHKKQEQQRVAVGPGNAQFTSIHQVSSNAAMPPPLL